MDCEMRRVEATRDSESVLQAAQVHERPESARAGYFEGEREPAGCAENAEPDARACCGVEALVNWCRSVLCNDYVL